MYRHVMNITTYVPLYAFQLGGLSISLPLSPSLPPTLVRDLIQELQDTVQDRLEVVLVAGLPGEDVGDHLGQQRVVAGVVEGAEVQEPGDVKQEVVVDDVTKRVFQQEVSL